jgi:hypothetical protein
MLTNSIDFSGTDKMTVWVGIGGVNPHPTNFPMICELSTGVGITNNGSFNILITAPNFGSYTGSSRGTISRIVDAPANLFIPTGGVILVLESNISGDSLVLRRNGTQAVSNTSDQGTGNYGNYPLYLFRRGGTTLPFNGRCYSLIVRGAQSSTAEITSGESYVNTKTRGY